MGELVVGTCGYRYFDPGDDWQDTYESKLQAFSDAFEACELNRTFYELPQVETAERWRDEVVGDFEFTVKAWQAVTHPWGSPTWNGNRDAVAEDRTDDVGLLRPTSAVLDAWQETKARADVLDANVVLLQTPPSFDCSEEHVSNMRALFDQIGREDLTIAWEPRGDWKDHPGKVENLCDDLDLVHVVDIFREEPLSDHDVAYVRLHGRNDDPYDYDYDYHSTEIGALAYELRELLASHSRVYCLFNNYQMYDNARALQEFVDEYL